MRDRIEISGIHGFGFHGVFPEEQKNGQNFYVDLVLTFKGSRASKSDNLEDAIDYSKVILATKAVIEGPAFNLIERLAEEIAQNVLKSFPAKSVEVTVHKPQAPVGVEVADIAIRIRRRA